MSKEKIDLVFVVLVYRNAEDLEFFFRSLNACDASKEIIIVNAFYDKESSDRIRGITEKEGAVFLEVENKGYGFGNNAGIAYAMEKYEFTYLIVANPDIEIREFPLEYLKGAENAVAGPEIVTLTGKKQNPMFYNKSLRAMKLIYLGSKKNNRWLFFLGRVISKLGRDIGRVVMNCSKKVLYPIYQAHGSFVIFSYHVLEQLGKVYDENIFLFAEESYLSYRLEEMKIPTFYCDKIKVLHKEDGSCRFSNNISKYVKESNIYVYEKYYKFNRKK